MRVDSYCERYVVVGIEKNFLKKLFFNDYRLHLKLGSTTDSTDAILHRADSQRIELMHHCIESI